MSITLTEPISFYPFTLADWVSIFAGVATVVVVFFLTKQMRQTDISLKLAYTPFISPNARLLDDGSAYLSLYNIGHGTAKEISIEILDSNNNKLKEANPFAIPTVGSYDTFIDMHKFSSVTIRGTYKDLANRVHHIDTQYSFP